MNESRKKRIGLLLAVILCLSLLPVSALAAGGSTGAVQWSLSGSTLTVKGRGDMPDYSDDAPAPWHPTSGSWRKKPDCRWSGFTAEKERAAISKIPARRSTWI